jgi:ketosteroid isomerase-like protein
MVALTVALLVAGFAGAGEGAAPASPAPDILGDPFPAEQAAVAAMLGELMAAVERKDLDRVDSFHLYGPKFSKFDEPGFARQDAAAARIAERNGLSAVRAFHGTIEDLKVDVLGPVSIATFVLSYTVDLEATQVSSRTRSTLVLAKSDAGWRIVHEHHSPLRSRP